MTSTRCSGDDPRSPRFDGAGICPYNPVVNPILQLEAADRAIKAALREDAPAGDVTSESLFPPGLLARAVLMAKQDGVLAGLEVAARAFAAVDPRVSFVRRAKDGQKGSVRAMFWPRSRGGRGGCSRPSGPR